MKVKILGTKMLAQCPTCQSIKMKTNNKYYPFVWQNSITVFDKLPKEICVSCRLK